MTQQYIIPEPPKDFFLHQEPQQESVVRENLNTFIVEKIQQTEKGIEVFYQGVPFPKKGFPFTKAIVAINIIKKIVVEFIKFISIPEFILFPIILFISPRRIKILEKYITSFNIIGLKVAQEFILKPELMSPFCQELNTFIPNFLWCLGVSDVNSKKGKDSVVFASLLSTVIDYDCVYRYRFEDILSETSKEALLKNPRKEVRRLFDLYTEREQVVRITTTMKIVGFMASYVLLIPSIKHAFKSALKISNFERFQLDDADRYWCTYRSDYNFWGKTQEERLKDFVPPQGIRISMV